jgi:sugar phosphate isomerase/epimerase
MDRRRWNMATDNALGPGPRIVDLKISVMSLIWGFLKPGDFDHWLAEAAEAGYDGVTGFAEEFEPFMERPADFAERLRRHGLALAALDWRMNDDEKAYRRYFTFLNALGSKLFVCIDPSGGDKDYRKYGGMLNRIGGVASEYGIKIHYHNHTAAVGETYTDMRRLIAEIDPERVSLMLDLGHATKDFAEFPHAERAARFLEDYWDRIDYLEFKDWNERTDLNTPLGEGYTDYDRVFRLMNRKGYSGWITVEQNGNDGPSLGRSPLESAKISREFIRRRLGV